jgi:hypothetical protein
MPAAGDEVSPRLRWVPLPTPADAKLILPGFAFVRLDDVHHGLVGELTGTNEHVGLYRQRNDVDRSPSAWS